MEPGVTCIVRVGNIHITKESTKFRNFTFASLDYTSDFGTNHPKLRVRAVTRFGVVPTIIGLLPHAFEGSEQKFRLVPRSSSLTGEIFGLSPVFPDLQLA